MKLVLAGVLDCFTCSRSVPNPALENMNVLQTHIVDGVDASVSEVRIEIREREIARRIQKAEGHVQWALIVAYSRQLRSSHPP